MADELAPGTLKLYRRALGISQANLAERLGISEHTLQRWERGSLEIGHPTMLRLAIENILGGAHLRDQESPLARLGARQLQVLRLMAQGLTNAEISLRIGVVPKTVENIVNSIYHQLEVASPHVSQDPRVSAVLLYLRDRPSQATPPRTKQGRPVA